MNISNNRVHFLKYSGGDYGGDADIRSLSSVGNGDIANLNNDDVSSMGLYDETTPLYQRLKELDELTASFLVSRYFNLFNSVLYLSI